MNFLPTNGSGLRVPGWAVTAAAVAIVVLTMGIKIGISYNDMQRSLETVEVRLCRIERAVNVSPWLGCPTGPPTGGGR